MFTNPIQNDEVKEKAKQTCIDKYGVDNVFKSELIKQKIKETMHQKTGFSYNFQRPEVIAKSHTDDCMRRKLETMKRNNSFHNSVGERYIKKLLSAKFPNLIMQHKTEKYPFACDFYIPELDLYIEYNGYPSHGGRPYTGSEEDLKRVELWKKKSEEINFKGNKKSAYLNYIHTWTVRDSLKRETAKENNLNWKEFFNLKEFNEWFTTL